MRDTQVPLDARVHLEQLRAVAADQRASRSVRDRARRHRREMVACLVAAVRSVAQPARTPCCA